MRLILLTAAFLMAAGLGAQNADKPVDPVQSRLEQLEAELRSLRARLDERDAKAGDEALRLQNLIQVYGDIGLRYHALFESQTETINRPEFRLHLGAYEIGRAHV